MVPEYVLCWPSRLYLDGRQMRRIKVELYRKEEWLAIVMLAALLMKEMKSNAAMPA
jgi:hypothetical protein